MKLIFSCFCCVTYSWFSFFHCAFPSFSFSPPLSCYTLKGMIYILMIIRYLHRSRQRPINSWRIIWIYQKYGRHYTSKRHRLIHGNDTRPASNTKKNIMPVIGPILQNLNIQIRRWWIFIKKLFRNWNGPGFITGIPTPVFRTREQEKPWNKLCLMKSMEGEKSFYFIFSFLHE